MNDYLIKTEEYKGFNINIEYESYTENPRKYCEHFTKFIFFHKRYNLQNDFNIKSNNFNSWEEIKKHLIKEYKAKITIPVYMYEHGSISLRTYIHGQHANFDCGMVGFVIATKEDIIKEYNIKRINKNLIEKISKLIEEEVEEYGSYLNGDIYCYNITDKQGNKFDTENYSNNQWYNMAEMIEEAKAEIDYILKNKKELTLQY